MSDDPVDVEAFPLAELRAAVRALCERFDEAYWQKIDAEDAYPADFVAAMQEAGWLSVLVPEAYGGGGAGLVQAGAVLEEVHAHGGNGAACHAQMYMMNVLLRHGSQAQRDAWLPGIASGAIRFQAFGVTEPDAGSDTTRITTFAERVPGGYVINGQKMWTSRVQHSDLLLLLARTERRADVQRRTDGMTLFLVDLAAAGDAVVAQPIATMANHETNALFIKDLRLTDDAVVGEVGQGFKVVMDGMNAERVLIASESIGDGRYFVTRGARYAAERQVFGKYIGENQGVAFPLARAHMSVHAAALARDRAAQLIDAGHRGGSEANIAKYLASEAAWEAANAAMTTFGGYGMAVEYGIERKFREARLYLVAPIANNLVLAHVAEHVLGMPRCT